MGCGWEVEGGEELDGGKDVVDRKLEVNIFGEEIGVDDGAKMVFSQGLVLRAQGFLRG